MSKVTTRPSNFADRTSPEGAFALRDVGSGGRNNGRAEREKEEGEKERRAYLSCVPREKGEKGPGAVSRG